MKYLSIYESLIAHARSENRVKRKKTNSKYTYFELHHIKPKCIGGSDDADNLVLLTAREHFVAHQLLVKIYPNEYKLVFALKMMCIDKNKNHIRNNKEYNWIRERVATASSLSQKGKSYGYKFQIGHTMSVGNKNGMFGKHHHNDTIMWQRKRALEPNRLDKWYELIKKPKSEKHKDAISKNKASHRFKLICPEGYEFIFDTIKEANEFCNISCGTLQKLAHGRYKFPTSKGWQCKLEPLLVLEYIW